ncbi:WYL domain-containing protein [Rhodococcus sp. D2-41]|uniref:helix-turn-helix transcriptional regulator n=1 Tax=Speluncibacter jeojiensis TaxID=2710754 RepID=UPI00240F0C7B|nr:WYL domain-containing protein [Rhodococcus sp. D2-41]MDG3011324.1 WYL domain-containing protein [Rhodococcus sp. D2-41]
MGDTTKRMLDLLGALRDGDGVAGAELVARLGVSAQTVQRDIERLRSYGYGVDAGHGRRARYRLGAGDSIPPLVLEDKEAAAVLTGLALWAAVADSTGASDDPAGDADSADRLMRALDRLVPQRVREGAAAATARMLPTMVRAMSTPGMDLVVLVARAIAEHELLVVTHTLRAQVRVRRVTEPYRLIRGNRRWYVLMRQVGDEQWSAHRVDRLHEVDRTGTHFEPRPLPRDAGDLWLDLRVWYDRGRGRAVGSGAIRCEDAR